MKTLGRIAAGIFAAAMLAGLALGASGAGLPNRGPLCPLLALTGIPCPFCGMTRATLAIGAGEWERALSLHPLAPLVLVGSFVVAVSIASGRDRWLRPWWLLAAIALVGIAKLAMPAAL